MPKYDTAGFTDSSGQHYKHTADCLFRISTKRWHTSSQLSWTSDKRKLQAVCDALKISPESLIVNIPQERCKCDCHKKGSQQGIHKDDKKTNEARKWYVGWCKMEIAKIRAQNYGWKKDRDLLGKIQDWEQEIARTESEESES